MSELGAETSSFIPKIIYNMKNHIESTKNHIVRGSGVRFAGKELRRMMKPCVYLFVKNDMALYVGMSRDGLGRPFGRGHAKARQCMIECDELLIYYCHSVDDAEKCETILIGTLQPKYNGRKKLMADSKLIQDTLGHSPDAANIYVRSILDAMSLES